MKETYLDILLRIQEQPSWWDENGVPRYGPHYPDRCPDIYADEVALVKIACQSCRREFLVQMSWGKQDRAEMLLRLRAGCYLGSTILDPKYVPPLLRDIIASGAIHYGDPPYHSNPTSSVEELSIETSCTGNSMNCEDLEVMEYWHRIHTKSDVGAIYKERFPDWARDVKWEIKLPDSEEHKNE